MTLDATVAGIRATLSQELGHIRPKFIATVLDKGGTIMAFMGTVLTPLMHISKYIL
jgi:hypothetical protein